MGEQLEAAKAIVEKPTATTAETEHNFDCNAGLAGWTREWSDLKKKVCCLKAHHGCEEEEAMTSPIVTTTSVTASAPTTAAPHRTPAASCQPACSYNGVWASCAHHIQSIVTYVQKPPQSLNCTAAWITMMRSCPECLGCNLDGAACVEA